MHQTVSSPEAAPAALGESSSSVELTPMLRKRHVKWQKLSIAVRSSWAFSQASKDQDALLGTFSRTPSYTAIDVEPEHFRGIDGSRLAKLVRERNHDHLEELGRVQGLASKLNTDVSKGIEAGTEAISNRQRIFGPNKIQLPSSKMLGIVLETFKDPILVVLFLAASLSLGFGIRKGFEGVSDGLSIYVSILVVVAAISFSNIWPTRQFHALSESNIHTTTRVVRDSREQQIPASEVVVGDLVHLQIGDRVPADGLYVRGISFQVNEPIDNVDISPNNDNPFLLARSKVTKGSARMLVTAVGTKTKWAKIMSSICPTEDKTPLQVKLHELTHNIAMIGLAVASIVLMIQLIKYFTGNMKNSSGAVDYSPDKSIDQVCKDIIGILVMPIVIATSAIPEGLLLAATITLAYSTKRMAAEKALVRNLAACEAIGSIKVICIDRSVAISSNSPLVKEFWLGQVRFERKPPPRAVLELMHEGIGLNTTSEASSVLAGELQTQKAICSWASRELGMNLEQLKENCSVLDIENLDQQKKDGCIWIRRRNDDDRVHIHMKGSMDEVLALCTKYYDENGVIKDISEAARETFKNIEQGMKKNDLNCIAYAHAAVSGDIQGLNQESFTLIGFLGLWDQPRDDIINFVKECQEARVNVKMITTEDVQKAQISAIRCGILSSNQTAVTDGIIEAKDFRSFTDLERPDEAKKCSVIAGASTSDKLLLVQCLKDSGRVGVIGGCPGDEKLFEEADVGFYLEIQESHSMKEKSDIIIAGASFDPIAKAMKWGRGIYNNIQIYAQFQLTATMASLVTDSITTIFSGEPPEINIVTSISSGKIPYAALQLLWVKLVVGTLVVLVLSVDDPAESLMQKMPVEKREPFITNIMWRDIIGQAVCQIIILLIIQFEGEATFKLSGGEKDTLIFNIFVLCQIFAIFNTVKGTDIFERLKKKRLFWMLLSMIVILQVIMVEFLKKFADTERLNWKQWRACIGIAMISWLVGWLLRRMPVPEKPYLSSL
ncbi:putative calcium-transporting ATPase 13, plasma membrane-type [Salvia hispanica]|uniref:putative calcium-transporting ATPase 13, plasma membrane-type n=1 Tax=Salvia hispanica TaxID=49212 RepID=UPI002009A954|nr:putative calcium-transporting ATPase 13, plasma membrane-type [Salvia hispanica]